MKEGSGKLHLTSLAVVTRESILMMRDMEVSTSWWNGSSRGRDVQDLFTAGSDDGCLRTYAACLP